MAACEELVIVFWLREEVMIRPGCASAGPAASRQLYANARRNRASAFPIKAGGQEATHH